MLRPPSKGFSRSVGTHNVKLDAMAEWIEGSITFIDKEISKIDVKDILIEESLYDDQDFAQERIDDVWNELRRRRRCLGPVATFEIESMRVVRRVNWNQSPAYSFCLMLALQTGYRTTVKQATDSDFTEQGQIFEKLTTIALTQIGFRSHSPGWKQGATNTLSEKVEGVGKHLGEPHRPNSIGVWTAERAKDCGLDVVCHLPFPDGLAGRPLYFIQCASGEDWVEKRSSPNLQEWAKLLDLATQPTRGISHPFVLIEDEFKRLANFDMLSLVLDRHRISRPGSIKKSNWTPEDLTKELNKWTRARLSTLKKANKSV